MSQRVRARVYVTLGVLQWLLLGTAVVLFVVSETTVTDLALRYHLHTAVTAILTGAFLVAALMPHVKPRPLSLDEEIELEQAMSRHPAGRNRTTS